MAVDPTTDDTSCGPTNGDPEQSQFVAFEAGMTAFTRECDRLEAQFGEYERQLTEIGGRLETV